MTLSDIYPERTEEARHRYAEESVDTRAKLRNRLLESHSLLAQPYRAKFGNRHACTLDVENRRLVGQNGYWLQWINRATTSGVVELHREGWGN
jgi:hypothetical protein